MNQLHLDELAHFVHSKPCGQTVCNWSVLAGKPALANRHQKAASGLLDSQIPKKGCPMKLRPC